MPIFLAVKVSSKVAHEEIIFGVKIIKKKLDARPDKSNLNFPTNIPVSFIWEILPGAGGHGGSCRNRLYNISSFY